MKNEQNNETSAQETAAPEPGRGRLLKILLCLFILTTVLFAGAAAFLASVVFSEPKQIPVQPLQPQDFKLQQKLVQRLYKELFRKRLRPTAQIRIKSHEHESLFRLLDFGLTTAKLTGKYKGMNLRDLEPEISKGNIKIVYPLDTGHKWLFGGILRFKFIVSPAFSEKNVNISLRECYIGQCPVPKKTAEKILTEQLKKIKSSPEFETFCSLVKEIRLKPDGDLVITYIPAKLAPVLFLK